VSRSDPSGADQSDAEHQARDVVVGSPTFSLARRQAHDPAPRHHTGYADAGIPPCGAATVPRPQHQLASAEGGQEGGIAVRADRVILRVVFWVILSVVLVAAGFWVYAIVTGGMSF